MGIPREDLDVEDLVRRYQGGMSVNQLRVEFGAAANTLRRLLTEAGVPIRDKSSAGKNRARKHGLAPEILSRFDAGEQVPAIARALAMSREGVISILVDHGREWTANRPVRDLDMDEVVRRYLAGESPTEIATTGPVSHTTIRRRLRGRGVLLDQKEATRRRFERPGALEQARAAQKLGVAARRRDDLDHCALARDYLAGFSVGQLGARYGCSVPTATRILREAGVDLRDRSAAGKVRAAKTDPETLAIEQRRRTANRAARLGVPIPQQVRERVAAGKHRNGSQIIGVGEEEAFAALRNAGLQPRRQVPVDRYNLDLAVDRLAVEVHRSRHGPHLDRFGRHGRVDKLTGAGWNVLYLWCPRGFNANDLEQVVALADRMRRDPAVFGQYTVFRCQGQAPASRGPQLYEGAFVVTTSGYDSGHGGDWDITRHA